MNKQQKKYHVIVVLVNLNRAYICTKGVIKKEKWQNLLLNVQMLEWIHLYLLTNITAHIKKRLTRWGGGRYIRKIFPAWEISINCFYNTHIQEHWK